MSAVLLVGAGGFLGAVGRYLVGLGLVRALPVSAFPFATLVVNVLGCLGIGLVTGWWRTGGGGEEGHRLFVVVGFLGGFTTFSAFGVDVWELVEHGRRAPALGVVALHLLLGLGAVWLGVAWGTRAS